MNSQIEKELSRLSNYKLKNIIFDYYGTSFYSMRDIAHKYQISLATAFHIVKSNDYLNRYKKV